MSKYRRYLVPGGTYFFTACLEDRKSDLLVREIDRLRSATRVTMATLPFRIDAIVVLPAAIHTIWTLPEGDIDYSKRWRILKSHFSRGLQAPNHRSASKISHRNKGIWQRRFWEHLITDQADFDQHRRLILTAPVQANLVKSAGEWPYSSWHRDMSQGASVPKSSDKPRDEAKTTILA